MRKDEITLTRTARILGLRYNQTWNLALTGVLNARQTETGRWLVSAESVERERARRESETRAAA